MTKRKYDYNKFYEKLDTLSPESGTALIKALLPKIIEKRDQGVKLPAIYQALVECGLKMKKNTFCNVTLKLIKEYQMEITADLKEKNKSLEQDVLCNPNNQNEHSAEISAKENITNVETVSSPADLIVTDAANDYETLNRYKKRAKMIKENKK